MATRKVLLCPQCFSTEMNYEAAYFTGQKYRCKACDYVGSFAVEAAPGDVERLQREAARSGDDTGDEGASGDSGGASE